MSNRFYFTDWLPGIGRYALITAVFQEPSTKNWAAEAFVFALDEKLHFDGRRLTYTFNPDTERYYPVDDAYMHDQALGQAINIIGLQKGSEYQKSKDIEILKGDPQPREAQSKFIILSAIREKYEARLIELADISSVEDLRQIIKSHLAIVIKIEPIR